MRVCMLYSTVDQSDLPISIYIWNFANVGILHAQIAALNLVLKSSNTRQNQKTTFSVKLTRIPWMFNKIFYFFEKYKWSPFLIWKNLLSPPFDLRKSTWSPPIFRSPPPGKKWHFPKGESFRARGRGALQFCVILGMCGQNGWVFEAQKPADVCKFLPKNLRMGHNSNT